MSDKVVIVGMNNPSRLHPGEALSPVPPGSAGKRLLKMSGMTLDTFTEKFERRNVLSGRTWSVRDAKKAGEKLRRDVSNRRVVVLGKSAWKALDLPRSAKWFSCWKTFNDDGNYFTAFLVPHPSGRCRTYNDPNNRRKLRTLMRQLAR